MEQLYKSNSLDSFQLAETYENEELFNYSKKNNQLIMYSKFDEYNLLTRNLNISSSSKLNSSSNDNSSNSSNINDNIKTINEPKNENTFLGKKKIHFDVIKKKGKKNLFQTNIINSGLESISFNKEIEEKKEDLESKDKKVKLFNTYKFYNSKINKGRWSYVEHIKFIKAFVYFRKDYGLIQKYINSRDSIQIVSHAQKYFKRLKHIKNCEYDFSNDKIKNLLDIFDIIEKNNKTNMNNEEYIINTLITLFNKISKKDNTNSYKKEKRIIKKKETKTKDHLILANKSNINIGNKIYENEKINKDKIYLHLFTDDQNQKGFYSQEINFSDIIGRNTENIEQEIKAISQEQENYLDYTSNNNFDECNVFLLGDSCLDEFSSIANDKLYFIN